MILSLSILRGVNLVAMDTNLISANSSDPYCEVWINDKKKIGWTPTQSYTLNPVWGGAPSTFEIEGGGGTKVEIKIYDYDELSADDPMGTVSFHARDLLEREAKDSYPNFWVTVTPPKGYENMPAGRLEIRLLKVSESVEHRDSLAKAVSLPKEHVAISPGPRLEGMTQSAVRESIATATTPVILHVYDVGSNAKIRGLNKALPYTGMGGIFHGAIEVFGREYSFGYSPNRVCGIFTCNPAGCPMHTYRESIYLGDCNLSRQQVVAVLKRMKPEWMGNTYNLLKKNCCTFSNELAIELGVGGVPDWVITLAHIGEGLNHMMGRDNTTENLHDLHERRTTWRSLEVKENQNQKFEDLTLEYVMAVRLQRMFRKRHPKKLETKGKKFDGFVEIHRATMNHYNGQGFETKKIQIQRASVNAYGGQGFEVKD